MFGSDTCDFCERTIPPGRLPELRPAPNDGCRIARAWPRLCCSQSCSPSSCSSAGPRLQDLRPLRRLDRKSRL